MRFEPPTLNVPLHRRDHSRLKIALMAGAAAWLPHRPTLLSQALISFFVGGAVLYFFFASDFSHRLGRHRIPAVRGLWFVLSIAAIVVSMSELIPFLHALA